MGLFIRILYYRKGDSNPFYEHTPSVYSLTLIASSLKEGAFWHYIQTLIISRGGHCAQCTLYKFFPHYFHSPFLPSHLHRFLFF